MQRLATLLRRPLCRWCDIVRLHRLVLNITDRFDIPRRPIAICYVALRATRYNWIRKFRPQFPCGARFDVRIANFNVNSLTLDDCMETIILGRVPSFVFIRISCEDCWKFDSHKNAYFLWGDIRTLCKRFNNIIIGWRGTRGVWKKICFNRYSVQPQWGKSSFMRRPCKDFTSYKAILWGPYYVFHFLQGY